MCGAVGAVVIAVLFCCWAALAAILVAGLLRDIRCRCEKLWPGKPCGYCHPKGGA
jgi:hypothetical protein